MASCQTYEPALNYKQLVRLLNKMFKGPKNQYINKIIFTPSLKVEVKITRCV